MTLTRPAVIFDLDGTLVDPAGGITGGIALALTEAGLPVPEETALQAMVGPRLSHALQEFAGVPADRVEEVIAAYRRHYRSAGMAASLVYPGIRELLERLRTQGFAVAVATQKPRTLARDLLALHGLADAFDTIQGSSDDETLASAEGRPLGKREIVAAALAELGTDTAMMVGDRYQDVEGASANGLDCVGVSWGFALPGELEQAGAVAVVDSAQELFEQLNGTRRSEGAVVEGADHGRI
ncbi:HAD hydrolase-like protein [Arthrobacter sp. NPDC090010]|uniref:HAD hydrolase-like protein n=1 Tax=Arthrobacter sp. NPDC090010 TaxID=3363942 RepID=UPI0037FB1016